MEIPARLERCLGLLLLRATEGVVLAIIRLAFHHHGILDLASTSTLVRFLESNQDSPIRTTT